MILKPNSEIVIASPAVLKRRYIEAEMPTAKLGISGRFILQRKHAESGVILEERAVDNLIVNQGLDFLATASGTQWNWIHIGTGTAAPAVTQTGLATPAFSSSVAGNTPPANIAPGAGNNWTVTQYYRLRFNVGVLNGTYTEIGIGSGAANTTLFSRALISPSITVLPTELLDVLYEFRCQPSITDPAPYSITITGVGSRNVQSRPASMAGSGWNTSSFGSAVANSSQNGAWSGTIGARNGQPTGNLSPNPSSNNVAGYTNGSFNRNFTQNYTTAQGNGSIRSFTAALFSGGSQGPQYQHELDVAFTKTVAQTLVMNFNLAWTRQ